jgi:CHAD domain-containing protein
LVFAPLAYNARMSKKSDDAYPLCQHLDELVDELRQRIPDALQEYDEGAVHKARVATRRLKASLELLKSVLDQDRARPFAKFGKKLRRRLGPLRDTDVMIGHLDEIKPESKLAEPSAWLNERLKKGREQARAKSSSKASAGDVLSRLGTWWAIRQDIVDANPAVTSLLSETLHTQLERFIEHANHLHRQPVPFPGLSLSKSGPGTDVTQGHADPHQLRIAGKSLRYTLELAEAEGHKLPKIVLRTFKNLQEHLGTWHDFVVMSERAMQACLEEELPLHDPAMQKQVLKLMDYALTRAQRELDRFSEQWAKHGQEISRTIRELFPLTHPATLPKTDHGPADSPPPPVQEAPSIIVPPAA